MLRFCYFILFVLAITSLYQCVPAKRYLEQGNYPAAIEAAANKLRKFPKKADKHILALEKAWQIELNKILGRIEQKRLEGQPDCWVEIHDLYKRIDYYQELIDPYLPLYIEKEFRYADIEQIDVSQELIDTKIKAAEYLYAKGDQLLNTPSRGSARDAYYYFLDVKEYFEDFRDVDSRIQQAYEKGQNHVNISFSNESQMIIPEEFMNNLHQLEIQSLHSTWVKYYIDGNAPEETDYNVHISINTIAIGAEQVSETMYTDQKEVEDGWEYVLDENGNVLKDSLGNDVKTPSFVIISAHVREVFQQKGGIVQGRVEYKNALGQILQSFPYEETLIFEHRFATYEGDWKALHKESKKKIGGSAVPFPSDIQMVMDASEFIKAKAHFIIQNNVGLVLN